MDLTTIERVRRLMGLSSPDDVAPDALLAQLITAVSAEVERALDRAVQSGVQRTQYFSPRWGQQRFPLNAWPNASITSVIEALDRDFSAGATLDSDDYVVADDGWLVIDGWQCTPGTQTLRVIHTGGMAATAGSFAAAYPDLASAVEQEVISVYRKAPSLGLQSLSMEGVSASWATVDAAGFQPRLKDAIARHRRVTVG